MSDAEDHIEPSSEIRRSSLSSLQQDSVSTLPLTAPTEQLPESADSPSTFSLFKDYFDMKLNALKRDIQAILILLLKSSRKNLRYPLNLKGTRNSSISTRLKSSIGFHCSR